MNHLVGMGIEACLLNIQQRRNKFFVNINGQDFEVTEEGFLVGSENFCDGWILTVAADEGIKTITQEHLTVIEKLRKYYQGKGVSPVSRVFTKVTGVTMKRIYELFPSGPIKGACKMAGIPKPEPEPAPALKF